MGNLLVAPITKKETHVGRTADGFEWGVSSMQGWRVDMEDAHITEIQMYASELVTTTSTVDDDGGGGGGGGDGNNNRAEQQQQQQQQQQNHTITSMLDNSTSNEMCTNNNTNMMTSSKYYKRIDLPNHSLFAVFDGHGGSFAAMYAGRNFCRVLSRQEKFVLYAKFLLERPTKEEEMSNAQDRVNYIQYGLWLLEVALTNAFLELDKEIACALQGMKVPDADIPYNDDVGTNNPSTQQNEDSDTSNSASSKNSSNGNNYNNNGGNNNNNNNGNSNNSNNTLDDEGDSGSTACVVLLTPEWVVCANAGDSRAVLSRLGNKTVPLSYDHKPDDVGEERRIRAAGGYVAGGRVEGDLAVSRGIGDFRFKNMPTVLSIPFTEGLYPSSSSSSSSNTNTSLTNSSNSGTSSGDTSNNNSNNYTNETASPTGMMKPGEQKVSPVPDIIVQNRNPSQDEFIIVACDGIWDVQTNYEAVRTVATMFEEGESDIGLICEEFCDVCLRIGSKDNMTAIVVKLAAQTIGAGGGVMARRQLRESEN